MDCRILIFGTGSVGAVYAYIFSRAVSSDHVFAICRSNHDAASRQGFTINSALFGQNLHVRPRVVRSAAEAVSQSGGKPFDYIVVTAKAIPSTPSLPEQIQPAVSAATTIVLVQNGIGIEEIYHTQFPSNPLLSCVVYLPASQTAPGVIAHQEVEHLHIGTYPTTAPATHKASAETLASVIRAGGGSATVHEDMQAPRWSKLLVNAAWNPICAISRSRDAQFLASSPAALDFVRSVMLEIAAVARAVGQTSIDAASVDHQLARATARSLPGVEPSMLADARAGRPMEVEAIVGNALRMAREKAVDTPLLSGLYALLKALDGTFDRARVPRVKAFVAHDGHGDCVI